MEFDLPTIWFGIIIFATLMYIVMDGFDLGIGILMPFVKSNQQKDVMVNTVAPVWDGNETWVVLGGAALYGAFPLAYSVIIDALSIPLTIMLIGLIFRGVAFEFRFKASPTHLQFWDRAFMAGSIITTFAQGIVVGAVVQGFDVQNRVFAGGAMDWFSPFPLFCGFGLMAAYALLGATWLLTKTEGELQTAIFRLAPKALWLLIVAIVIVSVWTPLADPAIAKRWFSLPNIFLLIPVPLLTLWLCISTFKALKKGKETAPFVMTLLLVFVGFAGLGISLWPNIIPPSISIWDAASPYESLHFMIYGAIFVLPVILIYTFWSYYVFAGKVKEGDAYH